jgi:hypothetical protein
LHSCGFITELADRLSVDQRSAIERRQYAHEKGLQRGLKQVVVETGIAAGAGAYLAPFLRDAFAVIRL